MKAGSILKSCWRGARACLPHEVFFGLLTVVSIAGLMSAPERDWPLVAFFSAALFAQVFLIAFCHRRPTPGRWHLRLFFYALIIAPVYPLLPAVSEALGRNLQDHLLQAADNALIGFDLAVYLQRFDSFYLTELLSAAYLSYTIYFCASELLYLLDEIELEIRFYTGLFTVFGLGFLGYVLIPANGPYLALADQFTVPVSGGFIAAFNQGVVRLGSNRIDVFPSLHCAVPAFILLFDFFHKRRRFWLCLAPFLLLLFSTVYLRYHYFIDLLAGFALALLALALSMRWPLEKEVRAVDLARSGGTEA